MTRNSVIAFGLILFTVSGALGKKESALPSVLSKQKQLALVRVNVTGQSYDYFRPWQKKAPFSKRALGAVLSKGRVLVTADLVTNQNYVELERAESGEKTAATVEVIDTKQISRCSNQQKKRFSMESLRSKSHQTL